MSTELPGVIGELRSAVAAREERRMLNSLPAGARAESIGPGVPAPIRELLSLTNGATCGDVTFFDAATVEQMQFYADPVEGAAVALSRAEWFCPGVISDEPFFVDRSTGAVWYFPDTGVEWWRSPVFEKVADDCTTFILEWVWGPGYPRLTGAGPGEQWLAVLAEAGRLGE